MKANNKLDIRALKLGIRINFPRLVGDERTKEAISIIESFEGEYEKLKNDAAKLIARNLVAWDTSKDKTQGSLPEVYVLNKVMYKELTGEEYSYISACEKLNILIV